MLAGPGAAEVRGRSLRSEKQFRTTFDIFPRRFTEPDEEST
jgi:hypothetical protein